MDQSSSSSRESSGGVNRRAALQSRAFAPAASPTGERLHSTRRAHPHPRHLRHLHGGSGAARAGRGASRLRLRCQRIPADERTARGGRRAPDRGLCTGPADGQPRFMDRRQRRYARQPADGGNPGPRTAVRVGSAVAGEPRARGTPRARRRRDARQDDHYGDARDDPRASRLRAGFPRRRGAERLRCVRSARLGTSFRDRSRRVRHGFFRQTLEVPALPTAYGDLQQPRVRSRRHFPGPRSDRDAIPPPGADARVECAA